MDCPSKICITEVEYFPEYQIDSDKRKKRDVTSAKIRKALALAGEGDGEWPLTETRFYVHFPTDDSHKGHAIGKFAGVRQPVDRRLIEKIEELVNQGAVSVNEVKRGLRTYVVNELFKNREPPPVSDRKFFPKKKDIRNHFYTAYVSMKLSKVNDQENLALLVEKWKNDSPEGNFYFRQYTPGNSTAPCDVTAEDDESPPLIPAQQHFLFVHQLAWQRRLLQRYGQDICLLDATYKTSKYALPLFFLAVRTNCGYIVVGSFVVQNETIEEVKAALRILKNWNGAWDPKAFMTDKSDVEFKALTAVFPGCRVYLCDFHREQCWLRWVRVKDNGVSDPASSSGVLAMWRSIADSRTVVEAETRVQIMKSSPHWMNEKLARYFTREWLSCMERWVWAYRPNDVTVIISTNNGVERQNRHLKEGFLKNRTDRSISSLADVLHKEYLPEVFDNYVTCNQQSMSSYARYSREVPQYLHNRPRDFVLHCTKRYHGATSIPSTSISATEHPHKFLVTSSETNIRYEVDIEKPLCGCPDFGKFFIPCKHMFAIIGNVNGVTWDSLPPALINSPFTTLDECVVDQASLKSAEVPVPFVAEPIAADTFVDEPIIPDDASDHGNAEKDICNETPTARLVSQVGELTSSIRDISFDVTSKEVLLSGLGKLRAVYQDMASACQSDDGLRRRLVQKKTKASKRISNSRISYFHLPKKMKSNVYAKRYGSRADEMRPLSEVTTLYPKPVSQPQSLTAALKKASQKLQESDSSQHQVALNFTPSLSSSSKRGLTRPVLMHGSHSLTLVDLKSIEPSLTRGDLLLCSSAQRGFKVGWLVDEVVNMFMARLCDENPRLLYASSAQMLIIQNRLSVEGMWNSVNLLEKTHVLMPWNPSGSHWILLVVDVAKKTLLYLDPLRHPADESLRIAHLLVGGLLRSKYGYQLSDSSSPDRVFQTDSSSCGVFTCMYAFWIAKGESLVKPNTTLRYRRFVYEYLRGNCLSRFQTSTAVKLSECFCGKSDESGWVQCRNCKQWFHCGCVGLTLKIARRVSFVCPKPM